MAKQIQTEKKGHNQAPALKAIGKKNRETGVWQYNPTLICYVQQACGRAYSQFALMMYLMGNNAGTWKCSEKDVLNRTGISDASSLSKVKKALKERGWIDYVEGESITVNYDEIWNQIYSKQGGSEEEGCSENQSDNTNNNRVVLKTTQQGCSEIKKEGCSENHHNNIINNNNNINNKIRETASLSEKEQEQEERKVVGTVITEVVKQLKEAGKISREEGEYVEVINVPKPGWYKIVG